MQHTSPLLEKHSHCGDNDSSEHGHALEQSSNGNELQLDGVPNSGLTELRKVSLGDLLLELRLGLDLEEFDMDQFIILW